MAQNDFDTLHGYFIEDLKVGQKAELKKKDYRKRYSTICRIDWR